MKNIKKGYFMLKLVYYRVTRQKFDLNYFEFYV